MHFVYLQLAISSVTVLGVGRWNGCIVCGCTVCGCRVSEGVVVENLIYRDVDTRMTLDAMISTASNIQQPLVLVTLLSFS